MTVDYSRVKSKYYIQRKVLKSKEEKNGLTYSTYEEVEGLCNIEEAVEFISQFVTDRVKMIHFTEQYIPEHKRKYGKQVFAMVEFKIKFLGDDWTGLGIKEVEIETDLKYGYSFLASALREKYTEISVCAKNLNKEKV